MSPHAYEAGANGRFFKVVWPRSMRPDLLKQRPMIQKTRVAMKNEQKPSGKRTSWRGRRAYVLDNGVVRLVTLLGGGHIAEFRFAESGDRPALVASPWKTIEPYRDRPKIHAKRFGKPSSAFGPVIS
jgi:hypothetical protein